MLTTYFLNRVMLVCFVAALAFALLAMAKNRGRFLSYACMAVGILSAVAGALVSWNGHDVVPDGDGLLRAVAAIAGAIGFAFLMMSRPSRA